MKKWIALGLSLASTYAVAASTATNVATLATSAEELRSACTSLATSHRASQRSESLSRELDRKEAIYRIQRDVEIYSIGNGRNQTAQYMRDKMARQMQLESAEEERASATTQSRREEVAACVTDATTKGKDLFAVFKKAKRPASDLEKASALMAAWLVNVESVSLAAPDGSPESDTAWKREKAAAALGAL